MKVHDQYQFKEVLPIELQCITTRLEQLYLEFLKEENTEEYKLKLDIEFFHLCDELVVKALGYLRDGKLSDYNYDVCYLRYEEL